MVQPQQLDIYWKYFSKFHLVVEVAVDNVAERLIVSDVAVDVVDVAVDIDADVIVVVVVVGDEVDETDDEPSFYCSIRCHSILNYYCSLT